MIRLRLSLIGDGTPLNPYRADLQTYQTVDVDAVNKTITVDVPPDTITPNLPSIASPSRPVTNGVPVVIGMTAAQLAAWYDRLDLLYGKLGLQFRPLPK